MAIRLKSRCYLSKEPGWVVYILGTTISYGLTPQFVSTNRALKGKAMHSGFKFSNGVVHIQKALGFGFRF